MNDCELLELAAKAVGMSGCAAEFHSPQRLVFVPDGYGSAEWDPLTDDGDALRLAVKLKMETYHADDGGWSAYAAWPNARGFAYAIAEHDNDACSATRRAIVRAAAEIGKGMP